jgi:DNA-binding NarL/FixJ family response regulator
MFTASTPIRIIIADDHEMFRAGFQSIIAHKYPHQIEVVGESSNGHDLVEMVAAYHPEVVVTDIQMPGMNGIEACRQIKARFKNTRVIAFSMFSDTDCIMRMLQAGADGYLVKTSPHEEMIEAIQTVAGQQPYYCSSISEKVYGTLLNSNQQKEIPALCFGEQEINVMKQICHQKSSKEIASALNLSTRTVENYKRNIQHKIGARNVVGIVLYAIFNELVLHHQIVVRPHPDPLTSSALWAPSPNGEGKQK